VARDDDPTRDPARGAADGPVAVARAAPLSRAERRRTVAWALAPVVVTAVVLTPIGIVRGSSVGEIVAAAVVYGGLLGLAAGFVAVDRFQARQCPRCHARPGPAELCAACGYDLVHRPRFACDERHQVYLDPGLCACGRRLQPAAVARGIGREVLFMLKLGGWLLALLLGIGLLLQLLERTS
jgi:hypothetical protein